MNFSLQATPPAGQPQGEAVDLPPVERPRRRKKGGRKLTVIIGGMLVVGGVGVAAFFPDVRKAVAGLLKTPASETVRYKVTRGKLPVTVVERGNLESSENKDVLNEVEGQTTIISIKPEGTQVKKGDLVCELDSATLRDNLTNQEITTKRALADLENAEKTLIVAQIGVKEYMLGTYPQEEQTILSDIKLAESDLERATDRLKWSEKMLGMNYVSESQVLADRMSRQKSEISLMNNKTKLNVLKKYSKDKQVTELEATVKKAESDKLAKEATYSLEKSKEEKLRKQIAKCRLLAPGDGLIVYANDNNMMRGNGAPQIEEGATVRERQKIFSLPDIAHMRVNTKVHESMVDRVSPGLPARIKIDALPNAPLTGTVKVVQPLPDPAGWMSSDVKMYTTLVSVEGYNSALRPGMTAQVEILVTQLDDVLSIPVQAVIQAQGKDYVYIMTPEGPKRTPITLGITNQKVIEVKEGLKEGDEVALNWNSLLSEDEKNNLFASSKSSAKGKDWANAPPPGTAKLAPGLNPPAKGGEPGKAAAGGTEKAKGKGSRRGGMPGMDPALMAKMKNIPQEDRMRFFTGSDEEKAEIGKAAGFTDDDLKKLAEMRKNMPAGGPGGGGGFGGGGPGGPGGGGFGGPGGGGGFGGGGPGGGGGGFGGGGPGGGGSPQ